MRKCFTILKSFFSKDKNVEDTEDVSELHINKDSVGCEIVIRIDTITGDFNLVVEPRDTSEDSAATIGLLLYYLNSGHMEDYFVQAFNNWGGNDVERQAFCKTLLQEWVINTTTYKDLVDQDKLAVNPRDVFRDG